MSARKEERLRLIKQAASLQERYADLTQNDPAPDEVLQHCREVVRFGPKSLQELREISFP
ncbi:hypothetical protein IVB12_15645 [Bradyrhizobium sp. 179]|uniref:hypothetical protein n=1 Tax=Bradyrhizobium sp. 179 TaxID=2782648 RepID=UPI001FFC1596|nr:hypothetical protein [Bradyrhizobium sp. 179]MCK1543349.1 hypothetical protein [Bradyrhizobium sp. 179]